MSDEWRGVDDAPKWNGAYLVFTPRRHRDIDQYSVQCWHKVDGWSNDYGISHWMPLPAPPPTS